MPSRVLESLGHLQGAVMNDIVTGMWFKVWIVNSLAWLGIDTVQTASSTAASSILTSDFIVYAKALTICVSAVSGLGVAILTLLNIYLVIRDKILAKKNP